MLENNEHGILFDLLQDAFDQRGIDELAFKLFQKLKQEFTDEMDRSRKIMDIVTHADKHGQVLQLLEYVEQTRSHQYGRYAEKLLPIVNRLKGQGAQTQMPLEELIASYDETVESFRLNLLEQNWEMVQQTFSQLTDLFEKVPKTTQNSERRKKYPLVKELFTIAQGGGNLLLAVQRAAQNQPDWHNEVVAAYLLAHTQMQPKQRQVFRRARLELPEKISPEWQNKLEFLDINEKNHQLRVCWQPSPTRVESPCHQEYVEGVLGGKNPYPVEEAEKELGLLFRQERPLFFSSTLYKRLDSSPDKSHLIFSPPGSGRTAMAQSLGIYHGNPNRLALYLPTKTPWQEIKFGFVTQLLEFILSHPTYLIRLIESKRQQLATLLVSHWDTSTLLSRLDDCLHRLKTQSWWLNADRENQTFWEASVEKRMGQLSSCIKQAKPQTYDDLNWSAALATAAKNLGFEAKQIMLVIDVVRSDENRTWLKEIVNTSISSWYAAGHGITTFVFIPDEWRTEFDLAHIQSESLHWTQNEFVEMLNYRWQSYLETRSFPNEHFEEDAWNLLIEGCLINGAYNPRRFMTLWCHLIKSKQEKIFQLSDVQESLKKLNPSSSATNPVLPPPPPDRNSLKKTISKKYNLDELKDLCFELGVDYDNLEGGTKNNKINALISHFERRKKLEILAKQVAKPRTGSFPKITPNHQG